MELARFLNRVFKEGGFLYDSDDYSDDLPFWSKITDKPHLIIPYTLDVNDMRFATYQGFNTPVSYTHLTLPTKRIV